MTSSAEQIDRIRFLYFETRLNQAQVARSVGVSGGTVTRYTTNVPHDQPPRPTMRGDLHAQD